MNESEETIQKQTPATPPEKPRKMPDLQKQIDKAFHTAKIQMAAPVTMIFGIFLLGVILIVLQNTRAGIAFCIFAIALIPLVIYGINFTNKKVAVPDELKNYIASFSPEQFFAARDMEHLPDQPGVIELIQPMEFQQENRYGIIRQHVYMFVYAVLTVLFLGSAAAAALLSPYLWFLVAIMGVIMVVEHYVDTGKMTIFDFHEKKIFYGRCRRFRPENTEKMKSVSFSDVDHLSLALFEIEHRTKYGPVMVKYIGLLAVKSDGEAIPLCRASKRNLPRLLALVPDLAEKMGHLPITFPGDLHL